MATSASVAVMSTMMVTNGCFHRAACKHFFPLNELPVNNVPARLNAANSCHYSPLNRAKSCFFFEEVEVICFGDDWRLFFV